MCISADPVEVSAEPCARQLLLDPRVAGILATIRSACIHHCRPRITCGRCRTVGACAETLGCNITLCAGRRFNGCNDDVNIVVHELIHVADNCKHRGSDLSCTAGRFNRICSELHAYANEPRRGGCAPGPGFMNCLCGRACDSVMAACGTRAFASRQACIASCNTIRGSCRGARL